MTHLVTVMQSNITRKECYRCKIVEALGQECRVQLEGAGILRVFTSQLQPL